MTSERFSELVKKHRKEKNLTQRDLAALCGLTRGTIMHIELKNQKVFLDQALAISKVLGINLADLQKESP